MKTSLISLWILGLAAIIEAAGPPALPVTITNQWDRRLIIQSTIAGGPGVNQTNKATNPRGWFQAGSGSTNYIDEAGQALLRERVLLKANWTVAVMNTMTCIGVIEWAIEGCENWSISYIGDPRMLPYLAPEMDPIADDYFKVYRDAHYRVGVTIRPEQLYTCATLAALPAGSEGMVCVVTNEPAGAQIYKYASGSWGVTNVDQQDVISTFYTNMLSKMEYAANRWGCDMFYIDSYTSGQSLDTEYQDQALLGVLTNHPNWLLIPELTTIQSSNWFTMGAPLIKPHSVNYGDGIDYWHTPTAITTVYPYGFGVMAVLNTADQATVNTVVNEGHFVLVGLNYPYTNNLCPVANAAWVQRYCPPQFIGH